MGWRAQLGTVEGALDAQGFQIYSNHQLQAVEAEGGRPHLSSNTLVVPILELFSLQLTHFLFLPAWLSQTHGSV